MSSKPLASELEPYIRFRYELIPLHRYDVKDEHGRERGKSPRDANWRERPYHEAMTYCWANDGGNVGVRLRGSDLVIDYDPRNVPPGRDVLAELELKYGVNLRAAPAVRTGSGGFHFYYSIPAGTRVVNQLPDFPGVEFKSLGRQVVAAGSVHPNGKVYLWEHGSDSALDLGAPMLPAALLEAIRLPAASTSGAVAGAGPSTITPQEMVALLGQLDVLEFREHGSWLEVMMACHAGTGGAGREEFVAWSTGDPLFADHADDIRMRWDSLEAGRAGGVTVATLYRYVLDHGGRIPRAPAAEDFEPIEEGAAPKGRNRFAARAKTGPQWAQEKPPPPVVDGLLVGRGVVTFFGPWGKGKTYLALDLGLAVAARLESWHGERLWLGGRVAYLCTEGEYALPTRLRAWSEARVHEVPEDFTVLPGGLNLASDADRRDSLAWLAELDPELVVLDTLAAACPGLDENAAQDMGTVLGWCRDAYRRTGALVLVVHHPPKGDPTTARGSGVLEANVDGVVVLEPDSEGFSVRAKKLRSGRTAPPLRFRLEPVDLGEDPDRPGRKITDAALVRAALPADLELCALIGDVARERGWPVRLSAVAARVHERRGMSLRHAKRGLEDLVPVGERNADVMSGLWREQESSRRPWFIHKREDAGPTDPRGHGAP